MIMRMRRYGRARACQSYLHGAAYHHLLAALKSAFYLYALAVGLASGHLALCSSVKADTETLTTPYRGAVRR